MPTNNPPRLGRTAPRGAAMIEMVLALPLVFFILAVLMIFGRGYERVQQLLATGRYEADRLALHASSPGGDGATSRDLVAMFFPDPEVEVAMQVGGSVPTDAEDELLARVGFHRPEAVDYVTLALERLPDAVEVKATATWPAWMGLEGRLLGPTRLRHIRLANDWKHANGVLDAPTEADGQDYTGPYVRIMPLVREAFFGVLDDNLGALADAGNPLAGDLRTFYAVPEPYRGPELPEDWFTGF